MSDNEVLSITYDIWISGKELDMKKKSCIQSVEIKETVDGSDVATIKISDPEFIFIEDNIFIEENTITVKIGWSNSTYRVKFDGYISAVDINFQDSGIPELTIVCMDNTHIMNRKKCNNTFTNTTSAEVVKKIVTSYGFTCVVDQSYQFTKQETITQSDQTDIDFIQKLAGEEVYPFTARLVGNTFYYVKKGSIGKSVMTLTYLKYPHDIVSFSASINKESKKVEIKKAKVDTGTKEIASSTGTSEPTGGGSISDSTIASVGKSNSYTYDPSTEEWRNNGTKKIATVEEVKKDLSKISPTMLRMGAVSPITIKR